MLALGIDHHAARVTDKWYRQVVDSLTDVTESSLEGLVHLVPERMC